MRTSVSPLGQTRFSTPRILRPKSGTTPLLATLPTRSGSTDIRKKASPFKDALPTARASYEKLNNTRYQLRLMSDELNLLLNEKRALGEINEYLKKEIKSAQY